MTPREFRSLPEHQARAVWRRLWRRATEEERGELTLSARCVMRIGVPTDRGEDLLERLLGRYDVPASKPKEEP